MKFIYIFVIINIFTLISAEKISIPFYIPSGATTETSRLYASFVKNFEKENPNIDIIFSPDSSYDVVLEKILYLAKKNMGFGVAVVEISELLTLKDHEAIISLEKLIAHETEGAELFLSKFVQGFLANSFADDGKLYGLPIFRSTPIIYYNMDILNNSGITIEQLPKNWEELTITLQRIKLSTGKPPLELASTWYDWLFEAFVRQNGGSLSNSSNTQVYFDAKETVETLEFWKMLQDKGLMKRNRKAWKTIINGFKEGLYPIIYYSSGGMSLLYDYEIKGKLKFNWMTDIMPKNKYYNCPVGAANIFISANMSIPEVQASWKFIKYLLKPDIQAHISINSGYFPVISSAFSDPILIERYSREQFIRAKNQLEYASGKIMTRNFNMIRQILKDAIDRTLDYNMPAEKSLEIAQREAQQWLK